MSDSAIARTLEVNDKTIAKALRPLNARVPSEWGCSS